MSKIDALIAIAIPTWGKVSIQWAQAFKRIAGPLGSNCIELSPVVGKPIAQARNELMQGAVENNCDFIFFLGDDVLPQGDVILRLLQRMWDNPDVDMVTGVYWTKAWPTTPYIWRGLQRGPYQDWKFGEFFEIDMAGCDCLLVRLTPEMKALGPEWFSTDWVWDKDVYPLLPTEDFYFYTKAREAGLKLYCDTMVQCIHEERGTGLQFALTTDMPQWTGQPSEVLVKAKTDAAPLVKLADIGCGVESPFFGRDDQVQVIRFDGDERVRPTFRCDIRKLPVEDQSFDVVHSRHVLEHFGRDELVKVMKEWTRILRVGGEFRLSVPNIIAALKNILLMEEGILAPHPYAWWQLYGQQASEYDFHKNGFTPKRIELLLGSLGIFDDIEVTTKGDDQNEDLNIYAKATKARHMDKFALLPSWDRIEDTEGIKLEGHRRDDGSAVSPPAGRNGNGVRKERVRVLAKSGSKRGKAPRSKAAAPSKNGHAPIEAAQLV